MLLKKVWESVMSTRRKNSLNNGVDSGIGDFDGIPEEVLGLILRKLEPKDAGKLCVVCKAWKLILMSDNQLWIHFFQTHPIFSQFWDLDSIFFSETHLTSFFPNPYSLFQPDHDHQLSLMSLFGLRNKVPGALIVDGGSGYCKYGWSKYQRPSGTSATFLEFGNIESPMYSRLRQFYAAIYSRKDPRAIFNKLGTMSLVVLDRLIKVRHLDPYLSPTLVSKSEHPSPKRMQVKSTSHPIVVSVPICHYDNTECAKLSRRQLKGAIYSVLFDMNVPAVCAINQATLALYAARRTSGIVVNIGFHKTSVVPILSGKIMRKVGVEVVGIGALGLTGFLREQMQQQHINFESLYTVRELKENLCYVAYDYKAELAEDKVQSYEVPREGVFTLSKECFQTGEILFQPHIAGVRAMALHEAVALCVDHCYAAELKADEGWFKSVVLCGGTACLPGLAERLEKELHEFLPLSLSKGIKVIPPPHGINSAWHGARLISNLSSFPGAWCMTKKQLKQKLRKSHLGSG